MNANSTLIPKKPVEKPERVPEWDGLHRDPFFGKLFPLPPFFTNAFPWIPSKWPEATHWQMPAIDICEEEKQVILKAELPGMTEKDFEVSHENGLLYIRGHKSGEKQQETQGQWNRESWQGSFSRAITLGDHVDWKAIEAKLKDGVLTITLPKISDRGKPVRVEVRG